MIRRSWFLSSPKVLLQLFEAISYHLSMSCLNGLLIPSVGGLLRNDRGPKCLVRRFPGAHLVLFVAFL